MTVGVRTPLQTNVRAAAQALLTSFRDDFAIKLQIYPARPRSINPPCAFVDRLRETTTFDGLRQRVVQADIVVIHGLFDSAEAASQRDAFVDNFIDWVTDRFHQAGDNTGLEPRTTEDDPNYTPDWLPPAEQRTYYATTLTLEGFAAG